MPKRFEQPVISYSIVKLYLLYKAFYNLPLDFNPDDTNSDGTSEEANAILKKAALVPLNLITEYMLKHSLPMNSELELIDRLSNCILYDFRVSKSNYYASSELDVISSVYAFTYYYVKTFFYQFLNQDYTLYALVINEVNDAIYQLIVIDRMTSNIKTISES